MSGELIEAMAERMAGYDAKQAGRAVKWPHMQPEQRSHWRHMARIAIDEMAKQRPARPSPRLAPHP